MNIAPGLNMVLQAMAKKKKQQDTANMVAQAKAQGADVSMDYDPESGEWKPKISYKNKSYEAIVNDTGQVVGWRPEGSVFQPKAPQINITDSAIEAALGGNNNPSLSPPPPPVKNPAISTRIQQLQAKGMSNQQIADALKEKGIDPTIYGL